jgi:hypothetical protein
MPEKKKTIGRISLILPIFFLKYRFSFADAKFPISNFPYFQQYANDGWGKQPPIFFPRPPWISWMCDGIIAA